MAYLSDEHELIYFAAPATGSSAVIRALESQGVGRFLPEENIIRDGKTIVPRKHSTLAELEVNGLLSEERRGYLKAVSIRNPFSFHVAKYLRNTKTRLKQLESGGSWINELPAEHRERTARRLRREARMTFEEYLQDLLGRLDRPTAVQAHFLARMDFYIHQEDSSTDFDRLCEQTGVDAVGALKPVNVSGLMPAGKTYTDYYTPELIELVYEKNAPSFERFPEYSFEGFNRSAVRQRHATAP